MKRTLPNLLFAIISFFISVSGYAQKQILSIGNKQFNERQYISARETYQILIDQGYQNPDLYRNLGDSYYVNGELGKAAQWYQEYVKYYPDLVTPEYYFRYALSLKANNNYEKADWFMDKLLSISKIDRRADIFDKKRDYLERIVYQSGRYELHVLPINSAFTDFGATLHQDMFVFSSSRDTLLLRKETHKWTEESFLKLYKATYNSESKDFSEPKVFDRKLDTKFHESTPIFTKDGNTIYFTGNRIHKKKRETGTLKIYRSFKNENGEWSDPEDLPFNSEAYSSAHPSLSKDEKTLYFSSDMPGGYGESDIYKIEIYDDGRFGNPINLKHINTEGRETFPFVDDGGKLYFASNGHPGLGGLDIFLTDINQSSDKIINIGKPVNSSMDDYAFYINSKTKNGFFSSNRKGGKGKDDIYGITELEEIKDYTPKYIAGSIKDKITNEPLKNTKVSLFDKNNNLIGTYDVNDSGKYFISYKKLQKVYAIKAEKKGYKPYTIKSGENPFPDISINNFELVDGLLSKKPFEFTVLVDPSHFDMKTNTIKEKSKDQLDIITDLLKKYKEVDINIKSFADKNPRGPEIAEQQSKLVQTYLKSKGVAENIMHISGITTEKIIKKNKIHLRVLIQQPIIFDYNSYKIKLRIKQGMASIIDMLHQYPTLKMEIHAHTDSRASKQYNKDLSIKRMNSIINHIIKKGSINSKRLRGRAFGETKLLNHCEDNIPCSEEEHEENRRVEFIIY